MPSPSLETEQVRVHAPGRVNLIGEHTDYTGGLVFPMAISRGTTLTARHHPTEVELSSDDADGVVRFDVPVARRVADVRPTWGRLAAGMAHEIGAERGLHGHLRSDIPAGAGLSSSAALMCAIGLGLGHAGAPLELAQAAQRAEHAATGVPTGIMDQYCIAAATAGHATLIDCHSLGVEQVPMPDDLDVVVRFVAHRTLEGSEYSARVQQICQYHCHRPAH
ncbi:MAG: galactokinase family protein, partial [Actinomycetota bacterium]